MGTVSGCNVSQKTVAETIINPVGSIMQAGGVSIDDTVPVTYPLQVIGKRRTECLRQCIFYKGQSIYFFGVDNQLLYFVPVQRVGHVSGPQVRLSDS